jgi:hypothetical protein
MGGDTRRRLTEAEEQERAALNEAVTAAIERRREWLDAKMVECSTLQVGDDIYNVETGQKLGVVAELYRYWRDRDDSIRDTSHYCDYQYETSPRCFDNTSRQIGLRYGTRQDAIDYAERRAAQLRRNA